MLLDPATVKRLRERWRSYLLSAGLCCSTLFVVLLILRLEEMVVTASIGATAFVVFAMPRGMAAQTTNTIGGHAIGLLCGSLAALVPHQSHLAEAGVYALTVGLCALLMLVTRYKHPPAAGTALGLAIAGIDGSVVFTVIASVILLSYVRILSLNMLHDFSTDD